MHLGPVLSLLLLTLASPGFRPVITEDSPPSRDLSRELCATPRLAGTSGSLRSARWLAGHLARAGWTVHLDERDVLLSLPRRLELTAFDPEGRTTLHRLHRFDPDAIPPGDVPPFASWSASGTATGPLLDVGRGLRADYRGLAAAGIDTEGTIALARFGGAYRGIKARLAQEAGCVGLLLYDDPASDGAGQGEVWPTGPWRPGFEAQRGSIRPLDRAPGDPSTPGWPSPAPGEKSARLSPAEMDAFLPAIPCLPIGAEDAARLRGSAAAPTVRLAVGAPREVRRIRSVIATLPGREPGLVVAGNHRDAWVRGAHDAGSGTVSLLRAAQHLGEQVRRGWRPRHTILLGFWDAEEHGMIGSTEWAEANADRLGAEGIAYVNADAVVCGLRFRAAGTPGLEGVLGRVLDRIPDPAAAPESGTTLGATWRASFAPEEPFLRLPGSGSDFTVFLHHLGMPVLDVGFVGNRGGYYHSAFDDFPLMDRFLDPTWAGHETAGHFLAELLAELSAAGRTAFDDEAAARAMANLVRTAGTGTGEEEDWLGPNRTLRLAVAFERLAEEVALAQRLERVRDLATPPPFYRGLLAPEGLPDRPWFKNRLWTSSTINGYGTDTLPTLRAAAHRGVTDLDREVEELVGAVDALLDHWHDLRMPPSSKEDSAGDR